MEVGEVGHLGDLALRHAAMVTETEPGNAIILRQSTEEKHALEVAPPRKAAM